MTLDKTKKYVGRFGDKDINSPTGSYKNKTDSSTNDGSFLEQDWANDAYDGLNGAFLANVHDASTGEPTGYLEPITFPVTLNENVDNAQSSQVYNAWYKKTQDVADGRIADKQLEEKIAELEILTDGCWFIYYSGGAGAGEVLTGETTITDFNFNDSAASSTKFLNSHQVSVTGDGTEITFTKAGMYAVKPVFLVEDDLNLDDSVFQIKTKVPNGSYTNYTGESKVSMYRFVDMLDNVSYTNRSVTTLITSDRISLGTSFKTGLSFTLTQSDFLIAVPVDGTSMKLKLKVIDTVGAGASFNFQFSMQRIGKYISNYTLPTDILVAP